MLQIDNLRRIEQQTSRVLGFLSPAEFYAASVGFLRRQFSVIRFALLLSLTLGVIYIFTSPSLYTGRAILIVDASKTQLFQSQSPRGGLPVNSAIVDTQIQILNSDDIALSVIKSLHLDKDPEFTSPSVGVLSAINGALSAILPVALQTSNEPSAEFRALQMFQRRLKVKRMALTYAIEIEFESNSPYRAAQIANAIVDAYEVNAFEAKYQITGRAAEWLQDRLNELREQASNSERTVVDYKAKNNIVATGGGLMNQQQLAELNRELIQARASTAVAKARLDRVQQIVTSDDVDPDATATATVTDTLHNDVINKMRAEYLKDERLASDLTGKYGANHSAVFHLRNEMRELRRTIFEELKRTAESYKSDYSIAKAREESIQQSLDHIVAESHTTDKAQVTLHNMESSAQSYRYVYDNFLQQYMESVQQQSSPVAESRLITHARPSLIKSWPKPLLVMALATLGGLIFGAAIGMLRDISDRVFRTPVQVGEHLHADCIAIIPLVKADVAGPGASFQKAKSTGPAPSATGAQETRLRSGLVDPLPSLFTEAIRSISSIPRRISDWVLRVTVIDGPQRGKVDGCDIGGRAYRPGRRTRHTCRLRSAEPCAVAHVNT